MAQLFVGAAPRRDQIVERRTRQVVRHIAADRRAYRVTAARLWWARHPRRDQTLETEPAGALAAMAAVKGSGRVAYSSTTLTFT